MILILRAYGMKICILMPCIQKTENSTVFDVRIKIVGWPLKLDFRNVHFVIHDSNGSIHSKRWNCSLRQFGANRYQYELLNKRNAIRAA